MNATVELMEGLRAGEPEIASGHQEPVDPQLVLRRHDDLAAHMQ